MLGVFQALQCLCHGCVCGGTGWRSAPPSPGFHCPLGCPPPPRVTLSFSLLIHQLQTLVQPLDLCTQAGHSGFQLQLLTDLMGSAQCQRLMLGLTEAQPGWTTFWVALGSAPGRVYLALSLLGLSHHLLGFLCGDAHISVRGLFLFLFLLRQGFSM